MQPFQSAQVITKSAQLYTEVRKHVHVDLRVRRSETAAPTTP